MDVDPPIAILSMTPPSSELDEFEKGTLLACSPSFSGFTYPSPTPSHHGHVSSVSSDTIYNILPEVPMSSDPQSHDLNHLSFEATSSESTSFFAVPPVTDPSFIAYPATTSTDTSYNRYDQNQWYTYSNYPQPMPLLPYDPDPSTPFTSFPHQPTQHGLANIIPPTPRDNSNTIFDFNTPPVGTTYASNHNLIASPAFSQSSRSHRSSLPSLSRSCSPVASLHETAAGRALSRESSALHRAPPLRSESTSSSASLHTYGHPVTEPQPMAGGASSFSPTSSAANPAANGVVRSWRCAYPGCTSRATFQRGCDLRKHYNRHSKHLFCRVEGCPQSEAAAAARAQSNDQPLTGGFSSKKDRARHEAKHNPGIRCEWRGPDGEECTRVFSRMDNMKDHVRRIHNKALNQNQNQQAQQQHQKASQGSGSSRK
ncbi:hypothetical protein A1O1_07679 [Capronia coronata CBS 617.96]|uniref:C2H2-type domain-containing protein n=1 Tax=Capronia coronata CBS 617.96 TaxID=1182541 RepID=W9YH49_9EURO|nr:uncharacterized protein A1O1_07679 [Capronia coronata CBS 617.96]EXJ81614.1 hypothetical protein A1O1_07679 [Capronia coronata CBS 617.96]